jgi:hypothetical protein
VIISRLNARSALNSNGEILSLGLQTASRNASLQSVNKCIVRRARDIEILELRLADLGKRSHGGRDNDVINGLALGLRGL